MLLTTSFPLSDAETKDKTEDLKVKHERVVNQLEEKAAVAAELKKKYELHTGVQKLEKKLFETNVAYSWAFFGERDAEYQESLQVSNYFIIKSIGLCSSKTP